MLLPLPKDCGFYHSIERGCVASPSVPDAGWQGLIPWSTVTKRKVEDCVPSTKPPTDVLWVPGGGGLKFWP